MITSAFPMDHEDGQGVIIARIAENLASMNQRIIILAPHTPGLPFRYHYGEILVFRFPYFFPINLELLAQTPGVFYHLSNSILGKIQLPLMICSELIASFLICRKEKITIIHTHWILPHGIIGVITSTIFSIPHICSVHGTDVTITHSYPILSKIIRIIARRCDLISVNSRYIKGILNSICNDLPDPILIPMGVEHSLISDNQENMKWKTDPGNPLILFVGRLIRWKGVHILIHAMNMVKKQIPNASLVIIGDGVCMNRLQDLVVNLHLDKAITFTGRISNQELISWYQRATVFVLPSISVDGQTEGLGVVLLEAMAFGVTVIGSNIGGIPDIIEDGINGTLVSPENPDELSDQIIKLLNEPELRKKLIYTAFKNVNEKFSWERIGRQFIMAYDQIMDEQIQQ